jgi:hypothetical protein
LPLQIDYAFANNNLDNLFHPAPHEVWSEFYTCKEQMERKYRFEPTFGRDSSEHKNFPPWLISKTCQSDRFCHA